VKLRIHGNAIRLRLNRDEVAQFSKMGYFEDSIEFGPGAALSYCLESSFKVKAPEVVFQSGSIQIRVPNCTGMQWATSDEVGISGDQSLPNGKCLSILIEKDFQCTHDETPDPLAYPAVKR
jgi:hypothetical protein